jgi:very-short-patch-repair endonuclease/DNA polymerase III delta prime subunit
MSDRADARLGEWKRKLLDLSKRNRLIHFKPTRVSTIAIVQELPPEVFRTLALEELSMTFLPKREEGIPPETTYHRAYTPAEVVEHHLDRSLQTDLDRDALDHSLLQIHRKATSVYEERGYNTLFLALGFLHWSEDRASSETLRAPLLLLPVELSRASLKTPFRLRMREEEPLLNPAIVQRLKADFGIELPPLPENFEELDPQAVFDGFSNAIQRMDRWAVSNRIYLGLFSFMKFFMYKDLEVHGATFVANPAVSWIAGEPGSTQPPAAEIPGGAALDGLPPERNYQVLDADSSQQEVIEAVKRGHHLVIEGPPGTGKSQTIANMIAECLAEGRSVLFVSEKMAALRVVYGRLQQAGLGDFCLELHSSMANKRQVMEELGRTLHLPKETAPADATNLEKLRELRDELNRYVRELREPAGPLGLSPFDAFGRLESVRSAPELPIVIQGAGSWTREKLAEVEQRVRAFAAAAERVGTISENPWRGTRIPDGSHARKVEIREAVRAALEAHSEHERQAVDLAGALDARDPATLAEAAALIDLARLLIASPRPDPAQLHDSRWDKWPDEAVKTVRNGAVLSEALARLDSRYERGVLEIEAEPMQSWWRENGGRLLRWTRPSWWRIRGALRRFLKPGSVSIPGEDLDLIVKARLSRRRIEKADVTPFGTRWRGLDSDWNLLKVSGDWLVRFRAHVRSGLASVRCLELAATGLKGVDVTPAQEALNALNRAVDAMCALVRLKSLPTTLESLRARLEEMRDGEEALDDWALYCSALAAIEGTESAAILGHLESIPPQGYEAVFAKHFYRSWLSEILSTRPRIAGFDGAEHDRRVASFREADRRQLEINRRRCRALLLGRLPDASWDASPGSELAVLQREVRKKRRHMPIRRLFAQIPRCLRAVKPCLMMSPLSVAQFLEPGSEPFDVVVFDEASQISPEDAIGAIARGRQVVVVGDSKQLPPTPFFQVETPEAALEALEDDMAEEDLESILDECATAFPCRRMLRWHYRSRHESLISFSNRAYYDGRLHTFPSPHDEGRRLGLELVHIADGTYDRGGTGTNLVEARAVARAAFDQLKRDPSRSVGIGAFSLKQQQAIQDVLEELRRADASLEDRFDAGGHEYCFVKNLETIQGDERDVILLSVGYGKDAQGRISMNFGPLNQAGGGRRLNVLVTRAREKVLVFASILPEDIDLSKTDAVGVRNLKLYLDYARRGGDSDRSEDGKDESPVIQGVSEALEVRGLGVRRGLGTSGYRLDVAIVDPEGRSVLGVECDGPSYQSAATARDRDRLRAQVLQSLGWRLHRIWSPEWSRRPDRELDRVIKALGRGGADLREEVPDTEAAPPEPEELPPVLAGEVGAYSLFPVRKIGSSDGFFAERIDRVAGVLAEVVAHEGPIHVEEGARRVAAHWEIPRMTARVFEVVGSAGRRLERAGLVSRRGYFYWPPGMAKPPLRRRSGPGVPGQAELIAPEEIAEAILLVLRKEFRVPRESLLSRAGAVLGFSRSGPRVRDSMLTALNLLRDWGRIEDAEGTIRLVEGS